MSRLSIFLKDNDKKGFFKLLYEMGHFSWVKKELPKVYIGKRLYKKDVTNYLSYLGSKEIDKITNSKNLHKPLYSGILRNKLFFAYHLDHLHIATPPLLGYNFGDFFVFNGTETVINDTRALCSFFTNYLKEKDLKSIFIKPLDDNGGKGCHLLTHENLAEKLNEQSATLLNGNFIYQAVVMQHEAINKIYKHSLNTIRFTTFMDIDGTNTYLICDDAIW